MLIKQIALACLVGASIEAIAEEVVIDKKLVKDLYESSGILGVCAVVDRLAIIASRSKNRKIDDLVLTLLNEISPSLNSPKEWSNTCENRRLTAILINDLYELGLF